MNIYDATRDLDEAIDDGAKTLAALRTIRAELGTHEALKAEIDALQRRLESLLHKQDADALALWRAGIQAQGVTAAHEREVRGLRHQLAALKAQHTEMEQERDTGRRARGEIIADNHGLRDRLAKTDGVLMELCQLLGLDPTGDPVAELRAQQTVVIGVDHGAPGGSVGVATTWRGGRIVGVEMVTPDDTDHKALNTACAILGCPDGVNRVEWLLAFAKELRHELNFDEGDDVDLIEAVREHVAGSQPDLVTERIEIAHILGIRDNEDEADILAPLRRLAALCAQQCDELEAKAHIARVVCGLAPPMPHTAEPEPTPATWPISPFPVKPDAPPAPPVDIEAVFAETAPVPDGWVYVGHPEVIYCALRPERHFTQLKLFNDGGVVISGRTWRHYPTLARAWEVAQDIARRLDAGEEVSELPPPVEPER